MQRCHVEEAFRTLKGDLGLRALFHQKPGIISFWIEIPVPLGPGKLRKTAASPRRFFFGRATTHLSAAAMRSSAAVTFSRLLNALMRTWPSPHRPKPAPGVTTTPALVSSRSKNCHESRPTLTQM